MHRQRLISHIQYLLKRSHAPFVEIAPSTIPQGGQGVFARQTIPAQTAVCLYPGVYSAGLPAGLTVSSDQDEAIFLGGIVTPSGLAAQDNAFLLNIHAVGDTVGGYLDGLVASSSSNDNPSACGHFVNHSSKHANVVAESFVWDNVFEEEEEEQWDPNEYFPIPNSVRYDHTPRYRVGTEMIHYDTARTRCCGVVLCSIQSLAVGDELLLDYGLVPPLPQWAIDWYTSDE